MLFTVKLQQSSILQKTIKWLEIKSSLKNGDFSCSLKTTILSSCVYETEKKFNNQQQSQVQGSSNSCEHYMYVMFKLKPNCNTNSRRGRWDFTVNNNETVCYTVSPKWNQVYCHYLINLHS